MKKLMMIMVMILLVGLLVIFTGCGTVNGFAGDTENVARWIRETTQKNVDSTELRRIRAGIDNRNRIVSRGRSLASATR